MLNTAWNMSKHGFSLIRIWENLWFCPYTGKYGYDFNPGGKIKIILLKVKRRTALRLTLSSLKLCRILESVSRKVTTSGVWLIVVTTIWSFSWSSKRLFSRWGSNVDAWSEINSTLSVAYSGFCQISKMKLFAKNT